MPNHIANLITLRGDEKRIAGVREQLRYQEDGLGSLDFNKLGSYAKESGNRRRQQYNKCNSVICNSRWIPI